jgi:hypothetical protein
MVCGNQEVSQWCSRASSEPARSKKIPENPGVSPGREMAVSHTDLDAPDRKKAALSRNEKMPAVANSIRSVSLFIVRLAAVGFAAFTARLSSTF